LKIYHLATLVTISRRGYFNPFDKQTNIYAVCQLVVHLLTLAYKVKSPFCSNFYFLYNSPISMDSALEALLRMRFADLKVLKPWN
jgi:hypothetical protein